MVEREQWDYPDKDNQAVEEGTNWMVQQMEEREWSITENLFPVTHIPMPRWRRPLN